jgi:hypothetical protein
VMADTLSKDAANRRVFRKVPARSGLFLEL